MYLCILVMTCLSIQIAGEHFMPYVCTYIKKKALLDNSHWQMHLTYLSFVKQIFTLIKYTYIHEWLNRLWRYKINWLHRQIYLEYIFQGTENLTSRNEQHLREKGFRQEIRFNSPTFFKCIKSFTFSMNILLSKRLAFFFSLLISSDWGEEEVAFKKAFQDFALHLLRLRASSMKLERICKSQNLLQKFLERCCISEKVNAEQSHSFWQYFYKRSLHSFTGPSTAFYLSQK
jgi:hypothetical protein